MTNVAVNSAVGDGIGGRSRRLLLLLQQTFGRVCFAKDDTVRVTDRLSHFGKKVENVRVIIQHCAFCDVVIKTRSGRSVQSVVEVFLDRMEPNGPNGDNSWRKIHILSARFLGTAEKALVEDFILQREHGAAAITRIPISLNHVQNVLVEVRKVGKASMTTILTHTIFDAIMEILAGTTLCFAEVMRHGIDAKEANETVELTDSILQRRTTQAPTMDASERKGGCGCLAASGLDHMSFVQNDPPAIVK
jgi:hypothetical protein